MPGVLPTVLVVMDIIKEIDREVQEVTLTDKYFWLRDAMLVIHSEWVPLLEKCQPYVKSEKDGPIPAEMTVRAMRLCAALLKMITDLSAEELPTSRDCLLKEGFCVPMDKKRLKSIKSGKHKNKRNNKQKNVNEIEEDD